MLLTLLDDLEKRVLSKLAEKYIRAGDTAAEVGTWMGGSAAIIGAVAKEKGARLVCVDPFCNDCQRAKETVPERYLDVVAALRGLPVSFLPLDSQAALPYFAPRSLAYCFIDGDHHKPTVGLDVAGYSKLIKPGGVLLGHDYGAARTDVAETVLEAFGPDFELEGTIWYKVIE